MAAAALLVALTLVVAFANGANDVSKGIATLVGSGVTDYRRAILWGTVWTVAGGIAAAFASQGLVAVFSGKGVLATPPVGPVFLVAVTSGAIGWLVLATSTGLPVSTTHALVGGLLGAGLAAQGVGGVAWAAVARKVALPLAMSPLLSLALVVAVFPVVGLAFRRLNHYCVCVERQGVALVPVAAATPVSVVSSPTTLHVLAGTIRLQTGEEGAALEERALGAGESFHVTPLLRHRMIAQTDCDVLEASTPELDDVVRLEDRYGRAK